MPRWQNNPADVALRTIYPPMEDTVLEIKAVKTVQGSELDENNEPTFWGVGVDLEFTQATDDEGKDYAGKKLQTVFNLANTEYGESMAVQFQMAAYGFPSNSVGQEGFKNFARPLDWSVDTESKTIGQAWQDLVGRQIRAKLNIKPDKNGEIRQTISWKPLA